MIRRMKDIKKSIPNSPPPKLDHHYEHDSTLTLDV